MTSKDRVAFILTVGLITWGIITIGGAIYRNKSLSEGGTEFFAVIGGSLATTLATYFTRKNGDDK